MKNRISELALQVRKNPDDSFSKFALALELWKNGDIEKTKLLFENIIETDSQYLGVYYHLAKLYTEIEETEKAVRTYKKGIEIASKRDDLHSLAELKEALLILESEMDY